MAENNERKFDEFLDSALADYSNVEPRTGLEGRILARLSSSATEAESRTWLRWWPAVTAFAAAVIVLAILLAWPKPVNKIEVKQVGPMAPNGTTTPDKSSQRAASQSKPLIHEHRSA